MKYGQRFRRAIGAPVLLAALTAANIAGAQADREESGLVQGTIDAIHADEQRVVIDDYSYPVATGAAWRLGTSDALVEEGETVAFELSRQGDRLVITSFHEAATDTR
ncbi:hypothetical protein [Arhodomonas sp. AD133]|uniref:hypothetical protein n=1 Tax=Arhodomonas sp. AD133 TaxID=3415009 RepID=UPI003EC029A1